MRWMVLVVLILAGGCFGSRAVQRSFYVLHADKATGPSQSKLRGLVRVRDLDAESVYEKFQIVIRSSPWQLRYSGTNLWAVRPNVMIGDILQTTLQDAAVFGAVTRELTEARPDFTLGGDLSALEVYDSEDIWFAHLAMSLRLTRFSDGKQLWRWEFDRRKKVGSTEMAHAVRAMSELLEVALREAMVSLLDTVDGIEPPPPLEPAVGTFFEPRGRRPKTLEPAASSRGAPGAGAVSASSTLSVPTEKPGDDAGEVDAPPSDAAAPFIIGPDGELDSD